LTRGRFKAKRCADSIFLSSNFLSLDFAPPRVHHVFMKLIIIPHNVTLTKAIEDHVVAKIEKLDHLDKRAIDARVTLEQDHTRAPAKQFSCSVRLSVRGPDLFAEDREEDLYAAIDLVCKKIAGQIRKRHSKAKAKHHTEASKTKQKLKERGL